MWWKLLIGYLVRILIGAIVLGLGIWYLSSSLQGDSISYISLDNFMNAIGASDGNIASANGCFMCRYINDLFVVLGVAAEKFWGAILENLWVLMVIGFGIFLFVHTIKYFYKALTDATEALGSKIGQGSSSGGGKGSDAKGSKSGGSSKDASSKDSGDSNSSAGASMGGGASGGGTSSKPDKYRYAQLAWISGNGTQYITTDIRPTNTTGIKVKFNPATSGDMAVVWAGLSSGKCFGVHIAGGMFLPFNEDWSSADVGVNVATGSDYEVSINYKNDRKRYVNGVSKLDITTTLNGAITHIKLFDSSGIGNRFNGRVYYLQITEGQKVIRDMVPVQQLVDGEVKGAVGMYDMISHQFHPNIGVGKFAAGPVVGYLEKIEDNK